MRVLVTGASGFSGAVIAKHLSSHTIDVIAQYRTPNERTATLKILPKISLSQFDLNMPPATLPPIDCIFHIGATSPVHSTTVEQLAHDNIAATQNLIKLAKATSCRKIIFFSTLSVYGDIQTESVHPKTPIINPDPYGLTKQVCELLISEYVSAVDGGAGIAIRLPGIVGKGAHRIWLSNVADALLSGNHIAAYNLDSAFNNAIHVEDLASFCHSLLGKNWRGFNTVTVGASGFLSVQETITLMASSLGISPKIKGIQSHKKNFTISNEHAIRIFDYEPSPISSIIKRYAQEVFSETKTNHPENPPSRKTS